MKNYVFVYKTSIDTRLTFQEIKRRLSQKFAAILNITIDLEDEDAVLRVESSEQNEEHIRALLYTYGYEISLMGVFGD
ncbi:hypothetical protein G5B30_06420 [Sphingobacterium sp. SGG-5]|uniref:hypothetical protein n=1 Tax=Sphingobacterium sp. SGG-5 TaxID=2710881 RepID=UPI0013EA49F3|nr:hypothetical protein [Sphingobacterium sp. SGG-5]NGM61551.1 hypothetical protein [Sphingobacterium sp. SGG-5]